VDDLAARIKTPLKTSALKDILDINDLQKLQDSFAKANRVASSIVDLEGRPITSPSNHSKVCTMIRATTKGYENCVRSGKNLGEIALKTLRPYCHFCDSVGFIDAAAPIVIEGVHMANWLIGQNCIGQVDEQRILSYAEEIGADRDKMLKAFLEMDKISEIEFREKLDFLWLMANQISYQAFQNLSYQQMLKSLEKSQKELNEYKKNLEHIVNQRTSELESALQQIQQIAIKDALTGCFNRGGINKYLPKEMKRARRYNTSISILLCDLDHFKRINDTYGHSSGDIVLQEVVSTMGEGIRDEIDWLARYGGEEFLLVMPATPIAGAVTVAERLRQAIADIAFSFAGETVHVTASFGVSGIDDWQSQGSISYESLLNCADEYLYSAKKGGRNQVISGPPS
jgi:diguanylate cyclase (GGDEF)-like protein